MTFVCSSSWVEAQQLPRHHLRPLVCEEILFSGMWRNPFFWCVKISFFWNVKNKTCLRYDFFDTVPLMFLKVCIKGSLHISIFKYIASALKTFAKVLCIYSCSNILHVFWAFEQSSLHDIYFCSNILQLLYRLLQKFTGYIYVQIYSICTGLLNKVTLLVATKWTKSRAWPNHINFIL